MIKIRLEKWEKAVVMQVLEMDELLRNEGEIFRNSDMSIKSGSFPELFTKRIYIWGKNKKNDFCATSITFINNMERDRYYNMVVKLFQDCNNRKKPEAKESENIFILE